MQKGNLLIDLDTLNSFFPQQEIKINQEFIYDSLPFTNKIGFSFDNSKRGVKTGVSVKTETLQLLQGKGVLDFQEKNEWEATLNTNTLYGRIGTNIYVLITRVDYEGLREYIRILSGDQEDKLPSQKENILLKKENEVMRGLSQGLIVENRKLKKEQTQQKDLNRKLHFDHSTGHVTFNGKEIGKIKIGNIEFFFFECLYNSFGKHILHEDIIKYIKNKTSSIDQKSANIGERSSYCSTIKVKLDKKIRDYIDSPKGGYQLLDNKKKSGRKN